MSIIYTPIFSSYWVFLLPNSVEIFSAIASISIPSNVPIVPEKLTLNILIF